jgi:hypothetical protein
MRFALLALTGFAACTSAQAPSADEATAIDVVKKLGGKAEVETKLSVEARISVKFEVATDATLTALRKHTNIGAIDVFDATKCTDKGYGLLKELPHLRKLVLGKANMTLGAVAAIGQCKELRHLGLVGTGVSDNELAGLKELKLLEHLSLSDNPQITDKGMSSLKGLERLRVLYLNKTSITDKGLLELKTLEGLRTLSVKGTKVTPETGDKFVDEMPNLRKIGL